MPSVDLEEVAGVGNFSAQVDKRCDELNRVIASGDGGGLGPSLMCISLVLTS